MSITSKAPNPEKGKRYFAQLDQALCNGSWAEIPELARKTDKHAPERRCFTLTARTEAQIASASHRPTSASSTGTSSVHSLGEAVPKLQQAIAEKSTPEDVYCAKACIAEIHWLQEDSTAALNALPTDKVPGGTSRDHVIPLGWLEVCAAKVAYIRAAATEASGNEDEMQSIYRAVTSTTPGSRTPELRKWTERLLERACSYAYRRSAKPTLHILNEALLTFRGWASFWQRAHPSTSSRVDTPRRQVWKAYYDLLSVILRHDVLYNPSASNTSELLVVLGGDMSEEAYGDAKSRQRAELKRVESTYESLLLNETQFPKASQSNAEVEEWTAQAVSNWKLLCGPDWTDDELGEGGKAAVGKGMLDVLYRAATKTFHSTAILRQLFTVHAALGEFELAMHAFNSYVEIVSKGKARAEKTGKHELGFDGDDTAILTATEAVALLCKYGDQEQAQKAMDVSKTIQQWLAQQRPTSSNEIQPSDDSKEEGTKPHAPPTASALQPRSIAAAYRAVGIAQAHWARMTYETEARNSLQAKAVKNLQSARSYNEDDLETAYALARVLAETQEVASSVEILKHVIAAVRSAEDSIDNDNDISRRRQLVPVWHLLALCLTAQDEYEAAANMCEAAFEQFGDNNALFGQYDDVAGGDLEKRTRAQRGIVDQMDSFERESLLQLKMSQLTFVELTEGSESAMEYSDELLRMYTRLFGNPERLKSRSKPPPTASTVVPPSRAGGGTLRSIAGSIRPRSTRNSAEKEPYRQASVSTAGQTAPGTTNGQFLGAPISITVTNEDGVSAGRGDRHQHHHHDHHLHLPFKVRGHNGDFRDAGSLRSKSSAENLNEKSTPLNGGENPPHIPPKNTDATDHARSPANQPVVDGAVEHARSSEASPRQPIKQMGHNASHDAWPPPVGHDDQPPQHDVRLPAPLPASNAMSLSHIGVMHERQHKISVLVKVWLFVAGLYTRADFFDDASGAVGEAVDLVESFEADKGAQHANARALFAKGWGGGKSVDELWADVWAAKGTLSSARELPFQAMENYEQALIYFPDHAEGIIGISGLLLDIYEQKMPAEEPQPLLEPLPTASGSLINDPIMLSGPKSRPTTAKSSMANAGRAPPPSARSKDPTPAELNRLAARDRAYMLLSNLTKLGTGWDNPEAWFTLARAHELSKQVGKAKQALWWVVELEDNRPMRHWSEVTPGGYTL